MKLHDIAMKKTEQSFEKTYHIINAMKKIGVDFSIENIQEYNSITFIIEICARMERSI